ncbi:MAG: GldG family protein [Elusimicrobia bacterium]|nr:GldG family protein [Candidatus Obscuribacterium magneticum]
MSSSSSLIALRRQKYIFSWTGAALVLGILAVLNFIISYIPVRLDTSEGHAFSISRGTKEILGRLDDTLLIRIVYTANLPPPYNLNEKYLRDLLGEYRRASHGKIRIEYLDPSNDTKARSEAMQSGVMPVQLDVRERDRREVKECFMGLSIIYADQKEAIPFIQDTGSLEYEITSRIKKLVFPGQIKVGLIQNGGALTLSSSTLEGLQPLLAKQYEILPVNLNEAVPPGIKTLWCLGPSKTLEAGAVDQLRKWVQTGGTLGLLIDRYDVTLEEFRAMPQRSGLEDLLREWGVDFRQALVVDMQADRIQIRSVQGMFQMINVIDYPYFPLVSDLDRDNPATKDIDRVSFPFVSPLIYKVENEVAGVFYTPLARSSKFSWLDTSPYNLSPLERRKKPVDSVEGPFNVGLLMEGTFNPDPAAPKSKGRVIVFGCSRFIRSDYPPAPSNYTLFLNLLDWSVQDEALLSIRSKGAALRPLKPLSNTPRALIKYFMVIFLPLLSLIAGLIVWMRHRTRLALLPLQYRGGS